MTKNNDAVLRGLCVLA